MPSPIAHLTVGYALYKGCRFIIPSEVEEKIAPGKTVPLTVAVLSLLPDLDSAVGLLAGNFGRYHNNATHSLLVGIVVALAAGALGSWRRWAPFKLLFLTALLAYESHVIMDSLTTGRGVMALWPVTAERFRTPFTLFYGFHWSDGLWSHRHLWTLLTESIFAAIVGVLVHLPFVAVWRAGERV